MLCSDTVVESTALERLVESDDEGADFFVERHVLHGKTGASRGGSAAIGDTLHFNETWESLLDEVGVALGLIFDVETLDQGETEDSSLLITLLSENLETALETFPKVAEKWTVDLAERVFVGGVDRDVKLSDRLQSLKLIWVLGVTDKKRRDVLLVQHWFVVSIALSGLMAEESGKKNINVLAVNSLR